MSVRRRRLGLLGSIAGSLAIALFLGAAGPGSAGDTGLACPPTGKTICVSIEFQDSASHSTASRARYLGDFVTIKNDGSSANLVNITVTVRWRDLGVIETTSAYEEALSDSRCKPAGDLTLSCTPPKSLGPGESRTYGPLVFRTATNTSATHTELRATATAKEQENNKKNSSAPIASSTSDPAQTSYDGGPDSDYSWVGGGEDGIAVTLATSSAANSQFSRLPVPATVSPGFAALTETGCSGTLTCFGQQNVTTIATGLTPINLLITYTGPIPPGMTTSNLVVLHTRSGDKDPTPITRACTWSSGSSPTNIPCRDVTFTRLPGGVVQVDISAWDLRNGDWKWG